MFVQQCCIVVRPTSIDIQRLTCNDRSMIRWIMVTKLPDSSTSTISNKPGLVEITHILHAWYGCVKRSLSWINTITNFQVDNPGKKSGRPKKNCSECVKNEITTFSLSNINPLDRDIVFRGKILVLPTTNSWRPTAIQITKSVGKVKFLCSVESEDNTVRKYWPLFFLVLFLLTVIKNRCFCFNSASLILGKREKNLTTK